MVNLLPSLSGRNIHLRDLQSCLLRTMSAWEEIVRLQQDLERVQAAGAVQVKSVALVIFSFKSTNIGCILCSGSPNGTVWR